MKLTEGEIQILIVLLELNDPIETPNNNFYSFYPKDIEAASTYFRSLKVDWSKGYLDLVERKLIFKSGEGFILSQEGKEIARDVRRTRPPIYYWYREFYPAASQSRAYAEFCKKLYGKNLCQAGFSDMTQIDAMIANLKLKAGFLCLDLGCGTGLVDEYLSDQTGARVYGVDYCPEAIEIASIYSKEKKSFLKFQEGNFDSLDYPSHYFEAIVSIDTLYMPTDLNSTIHRLIDLLKPGGRMGIFYTYSIWSGEKRESLKPENTPLGVGLKKAGLNYHTFDYSEQTYRLMQRKKEIGEEMKPFFFREGNLALYEFIINESESSLDVYCPETCNFARYLYTVSI